MDRKILMLVAVSVIGLAAGILINSMMEAPQQKVEKVENGSSASVVSEPLNFQGNFNNTAIGKSGLVLDTITVVREKKVAEGKAVSGFVNGKLYYTKQNGSTFYIESGERNRLDFDSTYGAVAGDFGYPGFNLIYANSKRDTYIRNVGTGEQKKLYSETVEVRHADVDEDGVPESAKIWLMNGTKFIIEPVKSSGGQRDWDGDGLKERLYIKENRLFMYDTKHGHKEMTDATSMAFGNRSIFIGYNGDIRRLEFNQVLHESGTYTSKPVELNGTVQFRQLITDVELPGSTQARARVITRNGSESFSLSEGIQSNEFRLTGESARVRFYLEKDSGKSPKIQSYELVYLEEGR